MELHDTLLAAVAASHRDDLLHDADAYRAGHTSRRPGAAAALVRAVRRVTHGSRPVPARPPQRSGPAGRPRAA